MGKTTQVPFEGQMVPAEELDFDTTRDAWSIYKLEDGTVLKLKPVLGKVSRIIDRYKPDGEPIYALTMSPVAMAEVPDELKKRE